MYTVFEDRISIRRGQHREWSTATKRYVCICMYVFMYVCIFICMNVCAYMYVPMICCMRFRWYVCKYLWLFLCVYQVLIRLLWRFPGGRRHGNSDWLLYCARLGRVHLSSSRRDRKHSQATLQDRYCHHTGLLSRRSRWLLIISLFCTYTHIMHRLAHWN